jgi:hypothetical protein
MDMTEQRRCPRTRTQSPVDSRHIFICPSRDPDANNSPSEEITAAKTALSCSINSSSRWYAKSLRIRHVSASKTSKIPSPLPVTIERPSEENAAHNGYADPNRIVPALTFTILSSRSRARRVEPLNMSN